MFNWKTGAVGVIALVAVASPQSASAAPVLDVSTWNNAALTEQPVFWDENNGSRQQSLAQSFVAGTSGLLSRIDVEIVALATPTAVNITIFDGAMSDPTSGLLGAPVTSGPMSYFQWGTPTNYTGNSLNLAGQGIQLTAGRTYSVVIAPVFGSRANPSYKQGYTGWVTGGPATSGLAYSKLNDGGWTVIAGTTFGLRTFVDAEVTSAVPEPTAWLMMMLGFGGIGIAMRRKKDMPRTRVA